jgi:hypothetical protein
MLRKSCPVKVAEPQGKTLRAGHFAGTSLAATGFIVRKFPYLKEQLLCIVFTIKTL